MARRKAVSISPIASMQPIRVIVMSPASMALPAIVTGPP
jgi:hypothetical protein